MSKKRSKTKLIIGLHLGLWLLLLAIYIFLFYPFYALGLSLLRSFGNLIPLIIIFYLNAYLINRFIEKGKYLTYLFFAILIVFVMIVIRVKINLFFPEIEASALLQDQAINWGIGALVTSLGILMLSSIYQILENRFRVESRNQAIINEQNEAQLQFLRAQINPHFLFNTLNNIYSLAVIKSDKTADMVLKLSTLLRYVIYDGKSEKVSIKREIKHISHFIDLFRMRSEQPPNIRFEQRGDTNHFLVEPMILIPIVENCFKHCDLI